MRLWVDYELLLAVQKKTNGANVHRISNILQVYQTGIEMFNKGTEQYQTVERKTAIEEVERKLRIFSFTGVLPDRLPKPIPMYTEKEFPMYTENQR